MKIIILILLNEMKDNNIKKIDKNYLQQYVIISHSIENKNILNIVNYIKNEQ